MTEKALRGRWSELLSAAPAEELVGLADAVLAATPAPRCDVVRAPEVGNIVVQVREPIARQRFYLADMLVSSAEVRLAGQPGWAMRPGHDRQAALAQAVCEAELVRRGPLADRISDLLEEVGADRVRARADEWARLQSTAVEFEEVN